MSEKTFCTIQCTEAEFCEPNKEGGAPSIKTTIIVLECEDNPNLVGTKVTEFRSLSGGATEYTIKALRNLGWTCNDITELKGVGDIKARGGVYEDEYNGKVSTKCGVWPLFKPRPKVTGQAKKDFAKQFKAMALSADKVEQGDFNKAVDREAFPDRAPQVETTADGESLPF